MKFHLEFRIFETITSRDAVLETRAALENRVKVLTKSGKLLDGGIYADWRGGYMIIEANTGAELLDCVGEDLADRAHMDAHPILSFQEIGEYFAKHG